MPLVPVPAEIERRLAEMGGRPVNLYRALANNPTMLSAYLELTWALRKRCTTSRRLRELMIVRGAQICESPYELTHHTSMARDAGVTDAELAAIADWRTSGAFSSGERAAIAYMEEILSLSVTDASMADLKLHFSDAEIIELTMTATFYAMVPRVLQALAVPLDEPGVRLERKI